MVKQVVIVGAGQAGFAAAVKLRQERFEGTITLLGAEDTMPYQRPPLSKAYLLGKLPADRLPFRNLDFYRQHNIELHVSSPATSIDRSRRLVETPRAQFVYDDLVLATGSAPVQLPANMTHGVDRLFYLRGKSDADALAPLLHSASRLLVVGGGYVGLEVAAAARQAGAVVTLIEMAPRILNRVAAEPTAKYLSKLHRTRGVDIRENTRLVGLNQHDREITAVLNDGTSLLFDAAVVGIGAQPETALASATGLDVDGGIVVDEFGRTSDPSIWAAGDCAAFANDGSLIRIESVPHAIDQAEHVARNILGASASYRPRPWFWSDQYETRLQIAGLNRGYDRTTEESNTPSGLVVSYFRGDRLLAVDCLNETRRFMHAKLQLKM